MFVSADESNMKKVTDANENAGDPVIVARNSFEIIVGKGNPKGIASLADLAKPDNIVVLCADTVPCGKGAATILKNAGLAVTPKSFEDKLIGLAKSATIITVSTLFEGMFRALEDVEIVEFFFVIFARDQAIVGPADSVIKLGDCQLPEEWVDVDFPQKRGQDSPLGHR